MQRFCIKLNFVDEQEQNWQTVYPQKAIRSTVTLFIGVYIILMEIKEFYAAILSVGNARYK